jgi:predicted Mrr-cat superfamily restriction endonuclease
LTKKTRDGGKDVIALKKKADQTEERILIECKHSKDKIRVKEIRELIGVAVSEDELPTGVILATTSRFTKCAEENKINEAIKIDLERKDFDDIIEWIGDYGAIQLSKTGINRYFSSLGLFQ